MIRLKDGMRVLGQHPDSGSDITLRRGPYGLYVQEGEPDPADKKSKPKRASLARGMDGETLSLDDASGAAGVAAAGRAASRDGPKDRGQSWPVSDPM